MQDPKSQKINLLYIFLLFGDGEEDKKMVHSYPINLTKNLTLLWTDTLSLIKAKKFRRIGHTLTSIRL